MRYYYLFNLQGDVIGITDPDGNLVGTYLYDSWGKLLGIYDANGNETTNPILVENPFRYRCYYYDNETGLYYLQSRYYDPVVCRFINEDSLLGANQDMLSYNIFAYCSNNPITFHDPTGHNYCPCGIPGCGTDYSKTDKVVEKITGYVFDVIDTVYPDNDINTIQIGFGTSAEAGIYLSYIDGIAFDRNGNADIFHTASFGGAVGVGGGYTRVLTVSDAPTIYEIGKLGAGAGISASVPVGPVSVSGGYDYGYAIDTSYTTSSYSLGAGIGPVPAEIHGMVSYTWYLSDVINEIGGAK